LQAGILRLNAGNGRLQLAYIHRVGRIDAGGDIGEPSLVAG
jgi:hypothetical protein